MTELKKCPFCGGEAELVTKWTMCCVSCANCFAWTECFDNEAEAIEAWNSRRVYELYRQRAIV